MGCWQKQHDFKPSANIPISTTLRPSSHDTSRSNIVLADPFSPSEHCWLTTWNFSAHDFPWFSSPPFMNSYFYLSVWLCVADAIFVYKHLRDTFPRADLANSRTRARNAYVSSLRKHPFLLALCRWGTSPRRRARRNGCFRRLLREMPREDAPHGKVSLVLFPLDFRFVIFYRRIKDESISKLSIYVWLLCR